jgi:hypothetical protein
MTMPPSRAEILAQIDAELERAAEKWGATRDDRLDRLTWLKLVDEHRIRATRYGTSGDDYRHELVVIAALAIAAIEAHDRREPHGGRAEAARSIGAAAATSTRAAQIPAPDDPSCKHRSHFECVKCRRMFCARCGAELVEGSDVWKTLNYYCPGCAREDEP